MAGSGRRGAALESLQDAQELQPFLIHNVRPLGRQLGRGSYGSVEELEMDGVLCAGKTIYNELVDPENQGAQRIVDMYLRECNILSRLRHPHIVQFLGICFLPSSQLPVLLMEWLQSSLDNLLETRSDIPLSAKLSILHDISKGLVYLHNHNPVIIHRDLTARNVLLNSAMTAKIADLGNSRIVDIPPGQLAHRSNVTQVPGTMVYMPPEAVGVQPGYGPSLDMFSFGHLALYTAIQVFPKDLLAPSYFDSATGMVKGRTELERRAHYVDVLHRMLGSDHPLVVLISCCLQYEAGKRPTAAEAMERLAEMRASAEDLLSGMNRLEVESALREKDVEIRQLRYDYQQFKEVLTRLQETCEAKDAQIAAIERDIQDLPLVRAQLQTSEDEKSLCSAVIAAKDVEITEKDHQLHSLQETCAALHTQIGRLQTTIQSLQREPRMTASNVKLTAKDDLIASLESKLIEKEKVLQNANKLPNTLGILSLSLGLVWHDPIELLAGVSQPQVAKIDGTLYIAGVESESGVYKITDLSIGSGESQQIETSVCWFGMAAVNEQLIIAGGHGREGDSDRVLAMDPHMRTWTEPYPRMPTARESPSALGYDRWMLVVGGWGTGSVEVLDTVSRQWYTALHLPSQATRPSLAVVEDNLYVAWSDTVFSTPILTLISHAVSKGSTPCPKWQQLPQTLIHNPALVSFHGTLLAIGGEPLSSSVTIYLPVIEKWIVVSKLPSPRERCSCVFLPDSGKLLTVGGRNNKVLLKSIDVCSLCNL